MERNDEAPRRDIAPEFHIPMQHRSKGVFALSLALVGAASAASCTNDRLDLFDPTFPSLPPAKDAGPNPTPDAASIDAPPQPPDATADTQPTPEPDAATRDAGAPPKDDAALDPTDAGVVVPEDTGRGNDTADAGTFDAPVFDARIDRDQPAIDAARPMDAGNPTGFDCSTVQGVVFHEHCYFVIAATQWDEKACDSYGAYLATLTSSDEQSAAAAVGKGQERWIGLRRRNNSPRIPMSFMWVTNEPSFYANWHEYSSNNREPNYTGECVRMLDDGTWADNDCSDRFPTLCEHD
jgi:hypothetical protein